MENKPHRSRLGWWIVGIVALALLVGMHLAGRVNWAALHGG